MSSHRKLIFFIATVALLGSHYAAMYVGALGAMARSAYVASVAVQFEQKCWETRDIECYRASWQIRAAAASIVGIESLKSPLPSGVDSELKDYIHWYQQVPPYKGRGH
jgi:hypothetical protein